MLDNYTDKTLTFDVDDGFRLTGTIERTPYTIIHIPIKEYDKNFGTIRLAMSVEAAKDLVNIINKELSK